MNYDIVCPNCGEKVAEIRSYQLTIDGVRVEDGYILCKNCGSKTYKITDLTFGIISVNKSKNVRVINFYIGYYDVDTLLSKVRWRKVC